MLPVRSPASPALHTSQSGEAGHAMLPVDLLNRIQNNDPQASATIPTAFSKHVIERALNIHFLTVACS